MNFQNILKKISKNKYVSYVMYNENDGYYIETNTTKSSIAEGILDDLISYINGEKEFHFGIKTINELNNKDDPFLGNCLAIYGVPLSKWQA